MTLAKKPPLKGGKFEIDRDGLKEAEKAHTLLKG
jgi:hypothetical protein